MFGTRMFGTTWMYLHGLGTAVDDVRGAEIERQLLNGALIVHIHVDTHKAVLRRVRQQRNVLHLCR